MITPIDRCIADALESLADAETDLREAELSKIADKIAELRRELGEILENTPEASSPDTTPKPKDS